MSPYDVTRPQSVLYWFLSSFTNVLECCYDFQAWLSQRIMTEIIGAQLCWHMSGMNAIWRMKQVLCKVKNFPNGEIKDRGFSNRTPENMSSDALKWTVRSTIVWRWNQVKSTDGTLKTGYNEGCHPTWLHFVISFAKKTVNRTIICRREELTRGLNIFNFAKMNAGNN